MPFGRWGSRERAGSFAGFDAILGASLRVGTYGCFSRRLEAGDPTGIAFGRTWDQRTAEYCQDLYGVAPDGPLWLIHFAEPFECAPSSVVSITLFVIAWPCSPAARSSIERASRRR